MATGRMQFLSESLKRITDFSFVLPNDVKAADQESNPHYGRPAKTLYLLHGFTGTDTDWLWGGGNAHHIADQYNLNVIMPTTGNSWYLDRPGKGNKNCSFIGQELVDYTRKLFGLSDRREDTLIGGFSMGGYGAIHAGFTYPETFSGIIALSSGLVMYQLKEIEPGFANEDFDYDYYFRVFGDLKKAEDTDINLEHLILRQKECSDRKSLPDLYLACGTDDFLIDLNHRFADFLEESGINYFYEEGPGDHQWSFWNEYIMRGLDRIL
ncbi:MAG: acetylesterase [Eubacterium sp.]|nr:acetylesterase [Eubacterium sp.]